MLRRCVIDYEGSWDRHIPLVESVYNNSFQSSIGTAPYEALYGRKCRTLLCWTKLSEKKVIGPNLIQETEEKLKMIRERLKVVTDSCHSRGAGINNIYILNSFYYRSEATTV